MADQILRSKQAFGTSEGISQALANGLINEFDVLYLADPDGNRIAWIDKNMNVHKLDIGMSEAEVTSKIQEAIAEANAYVDEKINAKVDSIVEEKVEESVETKVGEVIESANAYTDQKVAEIATGYEIVEF